MMFYLGGYGPDIGRRAAGRIGLILSNLIYSVKVLSRDRPVTHYYHFARPSLSPLSSLLSIIVIIITLLGYRYSYYYRHRYRYYYYYYRYY